MPQQREERIGRLLLKAVRQLPPREQDAVLRHLMMAWIGSRPPGQLGELALGGAAPSSWPGLHFSFQGAPSGPGQQTLPVRLSEKQHRELRDWCGRHNFSMAVVIRGLIEQFLEAQGATAAEA